MKSALGLRHPNFRRAAAAQPNLSERVSVPCLALDVCKTQNEIWHTTHGGAGRTASLPVCRKRPFATQADRLRPRLVAEALPPAGPVGGLVLFLLQRANISSTLPILLVTERYRTPYPLALLQRWSTSA